MCLVGTEIGRVKEKPFKVCILSKQAISNLGKWGGGPAPSLPLGLLLGLNATWAMLSFVEGSPHYSVLNTHTLFFFFLTPSYCFIYPLKKWDSCAINPLADCTHHG